MARRHVSHGGGGIVRGGHWWQEYRLALISMSEVAPWKKTLAHDPISASTLNHDDSQQPQVIRLDVSVGY